MAQEKQPTNSGQSFSAIAEKAEQRKTVKVHATKPSSQKQTNHYAYTKPTMDAVPVSLDGVRSIGWFIFLIIITCGIYLLYWIYKTTEVANADDWEPQQSPVAQLILTMFIPFYMIYWFWKTAKRISHIGEAVGVNTDNSTAALLLSIFGLAMIAAIILQDQMNKVICAANGVSYAEYVSQRKANGSGNKIEISKNTLLIVGAAILGIILLLSIISLFSKKENEEVVPTTVTTVQEITTSNDILTTTQTVADMETTAPMFTTTSPVVTTADPVLAAANGTVSQQADGRWAFINNGAVDTSFTGVASNQSGSWYIENGYVNFNFSGKVVFDGITYDVENGRVFR